MGNIHEKIEMLVNKHPNKTIYLLEDWYERMPEQAEEEIDNMLYGASIRQRHTMDSAIILAEKYTSRNKRS